MPFTNAAEADLLDSVFDTLGTAGSLWVGLSSTTPTSTGTNVTEPSTGGYARQEVTTDDFAAASGGDPSSKASSEDVDFGTASGTWSSGDDMTHATFHTAVTGGSCVAFAALSTPKPVTSGDPVVIPAGDLVIRLGKPTDSF